MKKQILYNKPLNINQDDVIYESDFFTILSWRNSIMEQIKKLPENGKEVDKEKAILETFLRALNRKLHIFGMLHIVDLKKHGLYKPVCNFNRIFQQVASEILNNVNYQQILERVCEIDSTEENICIKNDFMDDFDFDV